LPRPGKNRPTLAPETLYDTIVNRIASQGGLDYIEPFDHENSEIWHRVSGIGITTGNRMPPTGSAAWLTDDEMALLVAWIDGGAEP
jgi:hypothetical protein